MAGGGGGDARGGCGPSSQLRTPGKLRGREPWPAALPPRFPRYRGRPASRTPPGCPVRSSPEAQHGAGRGTATTWRGEPRRRRRRRRRRGETIWSGGEGGERAGGAGGGSAGQGGRGPGARRAGEAPGWGRGGSVRPWLEARRGGRSESLPALRGPALRARLPRSPPGRFLLFFFRLLLLASFQLLFQDRKK